MDETIVTLALPQELFNRLPQDEGERREYIAGAIAHELEGRVPDWLSKGGKAKTLAKQVAARENGKKGGRPPKPKDLKEPKPKGRPGRPPGAKNKPKTP